MVISREEAGQALTEIEGVNRRTSNMQHYRHLAPHLILWGSIWLIANSVTALRPEIAGVVWNVLSWVGMATSLWIRIRNGNRHSHPLVASSAEVRSERGFRIFLTMTTIVGYFITLFCILPHLDPRQVNAFISLFWAAWYIIIGIWTGSRMAIVGVLTSASILIAFFLIPQYYFLWMGLVTGSLLILGGAWLRKV